MALKRKRSKTKKLDENVQLNVNVNMTLEVQREDLKDYAVEGDYSNAQEAAEFTASDMLDGEEINVYGGRAWVTGVDEVTFINTYDENDIDEALEEAEDDN